MKNTTLLPLLTCDVISISYILKFFDENENNLINYTLDVNGDNILNINFNSKACTTSTIGVGYVIPDVCDVEFFLRSKTKYATVRNSIGFELYTEINGVTYELQRFYYDNVVRDENNVVFISAYDALSKARQKADFVEDVSSRTLKWRVNNELIPDIVNDYNMAYFNGGFEIVGDYAIGLANYETKIVPYYNKQNDKQYMSSLAKSMASNVIASFSGGQVTAKFVSFDKPDDLSTITEITLENPSQWLRAKKLFKFKRVKFRNRKKIDGKRYSFFQTGNTGTKLTYKWGMSPFLDAKCMTNENLTYARQLIANALSQEFVCFSITGLPALPIFEPGDWIKVYDSDTEDYAYLCVTEISISNDIMTLNCGDVNTGTIYSGGNSDTTNTVVRASASAVSTSVDNQLDEIQEQVDEITLDTKVVKEKTRKLDSGTYRKFNYEYDVIFNKKAENFLNSERIDVLSSRWLHAEKRLDVSPYETTGCVYDIEFPAVIYTTARHQNSKYMVEMRASATGVIPCTVSGTLNTEARIVGYVDSCTQYKCLDTSWDYGASKWYRNENHIHAIQKMARFEMRDANGNSYGINSLENLKIKFDNNSKFKSGGYGGTNNALLKAVKHFETYFDETATNNAVDDIGEYLKKASIYTDIPSECITKASSATVESNPGAIVAFDRHLGEDRPEYLSLCDSTLAHLGNYSLSGTVEDVLELVNDEGYWEIPANHFEYFYFRAVEHKIPDTTPGVYYFRDENIYLHIVQPEVYIDIGKTLNDIINKIYIDFGYIDKDDGWYSRNSSMAQPYWYNFTPKWSIAPYSDGHEDTWGSSHEGDMENDAVRGEYLSAIRKFRNSKTGNYPIYLVQEGSPFKLYANDTRYQTEYDDAVAMMEGDVTVYTNLFDETEESFISGKWNSSENIVSGSNSIIGSYNYVDGLNDTNESYTIVGSLNNIIGFAEHEKGEPDGDILIGSGNTLKGFKGLAFLSANYGFIVDSLNDDIWVYFGRTEKYSMRLIFKKFQNVITTITRNGTALTINDGVVDITVPEALSELTDDETHRLVTDTEKATWNAKQDALTWDSVPRENSLNPVTSGGIYAYAGNYYTKTEVDNIIEMAMLGMFIPVTTLPEPSAETMKGIYLVPSTSGRSEDNIRDEYITIALRRSGETIYQWELIGTTRVDLTGYVKKITIGDTVYTVDEGTANITLPYEPWATYQQEQDSIDEIFGTMYLVTENGVRLQTENDEDIVLA